MRRFLKVFITTNLWSCIKNICSSSCHSTCCFETCSQNSRPILWESSTLIRFWSHNDIFIKEWTPPFVKEFCDSIFSELNNSLDDKSKFLFIDRSDFGICLLRVYLMLQFANVFESSEKNTNIKRQCPWIWTKGTNVVVNSPPAFDQLTYLKYHHMGQ